MLTFAASHTAAGSAFHVCGSNQTKRLIEVASNMMSLLSSPK